MEELRLSI